MLITSPDRLSGRTAAPPPPRHPPIGQRSPEPQPGLVRGVDGSASTAIMSCPASALSHESYHACTHQIWSPRAISAHPDPARQPCCITSRCPRSSHRLHHQRCPRIVRLGEGPFEGGTGWVLHLLSGGGLDLSQLEQAGLAGGQVPLE